MKLKFLVLLSLLLVLSSYVVECRRRRRSQRRSRRRSVRRSRRRRRRIRRIRRRRKRKIRRKRRRRKRRRKRLTRRQRRRRRKINARRRRKMQRLRRMRLRRIRMMQARRRAAARRRAILLRRRREEARRRRIAAIRRRYGRPLNRPYRYRKPKLILNAHRKRYKKRFMRRKFIKRPTKCDMNLEIYPMYYTQVTRSTNFIMAFGSSCLPKMEVNFEVYYYKNPYINLYTAPNVVNLNMWGNKYVIEFKKPKVIDKYDVIKALEYREASLKPKLPLWMRMKAKSFKVSTRDQNSIFLAPQIRKTFNAYTIKKIDDLDGVCECKSFRKKVRGWKLLKRLRDQRLARKRKFLAMMNKMMAMAREEAMKRAKAIRGAGGRKLKKKVKKTMLEHPLPKEYSSKRKRIRKFMLKAFIVDHQINCTIS